MLSFATLYPRLRFALLTLTVFMVLGLNHQTVATLRVLPAGSPARVAVAARTAVVKQRVNLEATSPFSALVAPVADAWQPLLIRLSVPRWRRALRPSGRPRPNGVAGLFRIRLLVTALSPQAP
ncbi:hypothetical protein [Hymenobacter rubripertinctus]|uniref:Uncharacterized protein n=1 Tax=Hymenobacter rubripertinctus TaxID=2029981 RepID=A0A418QKU9_9BACT|nr:hypothetical protein [Hymenobacter rubripertinctus]RIY05709.1 hypothetical protein D0T11_20010 [Hymenobacter rubripertinctus]